MTIEIGTIEAIYRYPVKSMRGEALETATLGWHGVDGDRRLAFRRIEERGGFPWLFSSRHPELMNYTPIRQGADKAEGNGDGPPTHVRTPAGEELPLFGDALAAEIGRLCKAPVQMMQLRHGIFDDGTLSVIDAATADEICRLAQIRGDIRRFRPNLLVRTKAAVPFGEDLWVGGTLAFGDAADAPAVSVTLRDERCAVVNYDPDGGPPTPEVMKAAVRANGNHAGVYGTVIRTGRLAVGQAIYFRR